MHAGSGEESAEPIEAALAELAAEIGADPAMLQARALLGRVGRMLAQLRLQHEVELRHVRQCAREDALEHDAELALLQRRGVLESTPEAVSRVATLLQDVAALTPSSGGLGGVMVRSPPPVHLLFPAVPTSRCRSLPHVCVRARVHSTRRHRVRRHHPPPATSQARDETPPAARQAPSSCTLSTPRCSPSTRPPSSSRRRRPPHRGHGGDERSGSITVVAVGVGERRALAIVRVRRASFTILLHFFLPCSLAEPWSRRVPLYWCRRAWPRVALGAAVGAGEARCTENNATRFVGAGRGGAPFSHVVQKNVANRHEQAAHDVVAIHRFASHHCAALLYIFFCFATPDGCFSELFLSHVRYLATVVDKHMVSVLM